MPRPNRGAHLVFRKDRDQFYIRVFEQGRARLRATGARGLPEAEVALSLFLKERGHKQGPRDPGTFLISEALSDYARERGPETEAPDRIAYAIEALVPVWHDNTIGDISEYSCKQYLETRGKALSTVRRELGVLRAAINHAHRRGRISRPVPVWLPSKPPGKDRWLRRHEAAAILWEAKRYKHARLYLPLFVLIALHTGARKGAILDLRWSQVDLERGRIDFNQPGRKQTNKRRPVIPIPRRLLWFLRQARKRGTDLGFVVHHDGTRVRDIKKGFAGAVLRAGKRHPSLLEARGTDEDGSTIYRPAVTPHVLRHTAGTWMAQSGVDLHQIAGFLGHSYERTTDLYAHHHPDYLMDAKEALD